MNKIELSLLKVSKQVQNEIGDTISKFAVKEHSGTAKRCVFLHKIALLRIYHKSYRIYSSNTTTPVNPAETDLLVTFITSIAGPSTYFSEQECITFVSFKRLNQWMTERRFPHWTRKPKGTASTRQKLIRDSTNTLKLQIPPFPLPETTFVNWEKFLFSLQIVKISSHRSDGDDLEESSIGSTDPDTLTEPDTLTDPDLNLDLDRLRYQMGSLRLEMQFNQQSHHSQIRQIMLEIANLNNILHTQHSP